jgi:hypothetical protein
MSHFAKVENGVVTQVIVAEQDVIDSGLFGTGWVQTSYNTSGGQHPEGRPLRKNYAGIGSIYDAQRDAFMLPKPYPSWVLDEETCWWAAPVAYPTGDVYYVWDEAVLNWVLPENLTPPVEQPIIIETAGSYLDLPVEEVVIVDSTNMASADSISTSADSISTSADSIVIELSSNGADSVPGGV